MCFEMGDLSRHGDPRVDFRQSRRMSGGSEWIDIAVLFCALLYAGFIEWGP